MIQETCFLTELSRAERAPEVVAYYYKQWIDFQMPFHRHSAAEIMYVISGTCKVEVAEEHRRIENVSLSKGEFIMLESNVPHRLIVEKDHPCRMLNVEFLLVPQQDDYVSIHRMAAQDEALAEWLAAPFTSFVLKDPDDVYHILKSIVLEQDSRGSGSGAMTQLLVCQLLVRIARLKLEAERSKLPERGQYVRESIHFLHQNYDRDIQVKDVAAAVSLHPGYLQRIFKMQVGQTMTEYLTALRMERAKMLLVHTDIPIADISEYVGINSRQYFHALFKKHTSRTPVSFRNAKETAKWGRQRQNDVQAGGPHSGHL